MNVHSIIVHGRYLNRTLYHILKSSYSCQQVYSYFKRTKEDDAPQKVNIIAELMKKIASEMPANDKLVFLHVMCCLLLHAKPWQVDLPTSPVKILLQVGVDVNAIPEDGVYNCLTLLAAQNSERESFKKNQVTIARQLIEGGAQVNLPSLEEGAGLIAPLYFACASCSYTNLDFIQLLIENGANPNQQTVDGMIPLMSSIEMAVGAAIFILKFEHEKKIEVDPNVRSKWGETVWSMLDKAIFRNMGQRETVRETGKACAYSDKGWDSTEQYDVHIARLDEMKSLLEACGADMTSAPTSEEKLCDILPWQGHMFNIKEFLQQSSPTLGVATTKTRNESLQCKVSDLFNIDILRDKKAPSWSKDGNGKSCFYVEDKRTKIFEDHEGVEYLHSAGGRKPAIGMGLLICCNIPTSHNACRLVGKIVEKSKPRNDEYLRRSARTSNPSALFGKPCPCNKRDCQFTKTGKRLDIISKYGAVHGDEVKGVVKLAKDCEANSEFVAFFGKKKKFDVVLRCNDNHQNMWEMVRISPHISGTG
jgi:hypothetical protein